MKKILIGILVLGSFSSFANTNSTCIDDVMDEISLTTLVAKKMDALSSALEIAVENEDMDEALAVIEKVDQLTDSVEDVASKVCAK
jgi:protein-arginine kinase activator protein McsA